jgi:hypothetical protein
MNSISITHKDNLVTVPLSNSNRTVTLDAVDFESLMAKGISPRWKLSQAGKVMVGNNHTVARLILDAGKGFRVRYLDNDPTNLRRTNLILANHSKPIINVNHIFRQNQGESVLNAN